jgi:hypothetical protein
MVRGCFHTKRFRKRQVVGMLILATPYGTNASFAPLAEPPGVGPPATT